MKRSRTGALLAMALTITAIGVGAAGTVRAATITTENSGDCTRSSAPGGTPATYEMQAGDSCTITFSVVLTGGTDVASALRANVSLLDPADAFASPTMTFGGPTWGTPQSSYDGQVFVVSVLSDNMAGNRQFAVAVIVGSTPGSTMQIVLDDLILGRDINDPPFIADVPYTPSPGSTLAFVTVVPEPGTLSLLAIGLGLLARTRRRS